MLPILSFSHPTLTLQFRVIHIEFNRDDRSVSLRWWSLWKSLDNGYNIQNFPSSGIYYSIHRSFHTSTFQHFHSLLFCIKNLTCLPTHVVDNFETERGCMLLCSIDLTALTCIHVRCHNFENVPLWRITFKHSSWIQVEPMEWKVAKSFIGKIRTGSHLL